MKIEAKREPSLYRESELTSFLASSPYDPSGWEKSLAQIRTRTFRRNELADILLTYNKSIGNDETALRNIESFRSKESICVFTGQQLGFMGGPSYTILKAISCLALANKRNAIPVFWLATEDHDIDEIDHAYLIEASGNLKKFHLSLQKDGRPVEDLELAAEHRESIKNFLEAVGEGDLYGDLGEERSYTRMMAKVLVKLFQGTGLIFLEPYLLRPLAKDFLKREIIDAGKIEHILQDTTKRLQASGGRAQLEIAGGTNLFYKMKGLFRTKIVKSGGRFMYGKKDSSESEMLKLIDESPENFSLSAAARPVLQNLLFPTAAYVAGPAEIAYFHQLRDYHDYHGAAMPWIVPRISTTMIPREAKIVLEKSGLNPWDEIPSHWEKVFPEVTQGIGETAKELFVSAKKHLSPDISDEALKTFVGNFQSRLQRKMTKLRMKKKGVDHHSLHYLRNLIHPHEKLQERVLNWWEFQGSIKENLVMQMLNLVEIPFSGHLYCYL